MSYTIQAKTKPKTGPKCEIGAERTWEKAVRTVEQIIQARNYRPFACRYPSPLPFFQCFESLLHFQHYTTAMVTNAY